MIQIGLRECASGPRTLQDKEVRVRWAVGEVLHVLAEKRGPPVWEHMREPILDSIHNNFVSSPLMLGAAGHAGGAGRGACATHTGLLFGKRTGAAAECEQRLQDAGPAG